MNIRLKLKNVIKGCKKDINVINSSSLTKKQKEKEINLMLNNLKQLTKDLGFNDFSFGHPKKQRSKLVRDLPKELREIIYKKYHKQNIQSDCLNILRSIINIFKNQLNEYCPTRRDFFHYYSPHRNRQDYQSLMNLIKSLSDECKDFLQKMIPKFKRSLNDDPMEMLWLLYQEYGPKERTNADRAFDDF